jgi:RNA polymerase sigma factor (sigma-70 family)
MGRTTCNGCPERPTCRKLCADIRSLLPGLDKGRKHETIPDRLVRAPSSQDAQRRLDSIDRVRAALDSLPPTQYRRAAEMHLWEGKSYGEIAAELGIAKTTVDRHMAVARKKCARILSARQGVREMSSPTSRAGAGGRKAYK